MTGLPDLPIKANLVHNGFCHCSAGQNPIPRRTRFPWENVFCIPTCDPRQTSPRCTSTGRYLLNSWESRACGCSVGPVGTGGLPAAPLCSLPLLLVAPAHRALHCWMEHARTEHSPRQSSAQEPRLVSQPKGLNFLFQYSSPTPQIYFFPWSPHVGL